ncbi:DNA-binding response regulator [Variovorax beijingensis]|uniref:DNA-binding response regulator n=1 Tax=Variovorax beijingensis TaxID=2496117 RepID=A0A3P3ENC0_9BURK|nr:DNA-binding response regulator [Variovorax beijingensis]
MEQVPRPSARLGSAWNADPQPSAQDSRALSPFALPALSTSNCFQPACPQIASPAPGTAFEAGVPVLIATCPSRASALHGLGLLASRHRSGRMYQVEHAEINSLSDLETCCRQHAPRLLLLDIALISPEAVGRLDDLRRHFPATDWLLGWERPSTQGLDAAIRIQARGCVEWTANAEQLAQSLDAVLAGTLGFPDPVLQALYLAVLRLVAAGGRPACSATSPAVKLTAREDEVLSLMHRDMSNKQIAERLGISVNTVKKHLAHVSAKQGQHSRRWHLARPGLVGPVPERSISHLEPAPSPLPMEKLKMVAASNVSRDAGYFKNVTGGQLPRISYHLGGATDNELLETAASKIDAHLSCYAGWPNAFSAVLAMKSAFEVRGK